MKKFLLVLSVILLIIPLCLFLLRCTIEPEDELDMPEEVGIDFSTMKYAAFGDSITYGYGCTHSYPELVSDTLGFRSFSNEAVSGATLSDNDLGLDVISNLIIEYTKEADIISVMGGVNDFVKGLPLGDIDDSTNATIYGSLNVIAEYLTTHYSYSYVFFITPYPTTRSGGSDYELTDIVVAIKRVAQNYNIDVLNLYSQGQFELFYENSDCDGVHPTQNFVTNYTAPQIASFIKENYH